MRALITGITGQDGAYLARLLKDYGYEVYGAYRRGSSPRTERLDYLSVSPEMVPFELSEYENVKRTIDKIKPDEIYNLAAQSFVADSFELPVYTCDVNGMGVLRILEAIRGTNIKMYQASTSEMFGNEPAKQNEETPFRPRSPYGCSKVLAHNLCVNYRESYGTRVSCGILFNHESPIRGDEFVTQKIAKGIWNSHLYLGNLSARRDWGHARDYVQAMWLMLQHDPDDFVIATGEAHSVSDFVNAAKMVVTEEGFDPATVTVDPQFYRPAEVNHLCGDATKAREVLGWKPEISFDCLVTEMTLAGRPECTEFSSDLTDAK